MAGNEAIQVPKDVQQVASPEPAQKDVDEKAQGISLTEDQRVIDQKDLVTQSFVWLEQAAQESIELLKSQLKEEPSWQQELVQVALEVALGAGASAVGEHIAGLFAGHNASGEVGKEFVKEMFAGSVEQGVAAGVSKLGKHGDELLPAKFIAAQKEGARRTQMTNQTLWITTGRHQEMSLEAASKLASVCSETNFKAAAVNYYEAARNAWVSYIAQSTFGDNRGNTNMQDQKHRDSSHTEGDAPSARLAEIGENDGILTLNVKLGTVFGTSITHEAQVMDACINGVSEEVREQYAGKPLSKSPIPRLIRAVIDSNDIFELSVTEDGVLGGHLSHEGQYWLANRPLVGHPENYTIDGFSRKIMGLSLLLDDLVPDSIEGKLGQLTDYAFNKN